MINITVLQTVIKGECMKVLMLNGSPHESGNTMCVLREMERIFHENAIDTKIITIGNKVIRGCVACGSCAKTGKCAIDDEVNVIAKDFEESDGVVIGSPVYFSSANGTLISLLDRLFYSTHFDKRGKVGAAVVVARRGGLSATFDELNKYFSIAQMPIATSCYWNSAHGRTANEVLQDTEGMRTIRTLARNMAFLMKCVALGRDQYGFPPQEDPVKTNFIR